MNIGIPTEIKNNEYRVGMTPAGVFSLVQHGHTVYVEDGAGLGSGYDNKTYQKAGATILTTAKEVFNTSEMIIKVKEPLKEEYGLIRENQLIYTFFHFAASEELTQAMIDRRAICLTYETITDDSGSLPLLTPMSEVAGRLASQQGAKYLESPQGGLGILLGGVPGVAPAEVMVLGGGVVGTQAALVAAGMGASVRIFDINLNRLRYLDNIMPKNVTTVYSTPYAIEKHLPSTHLVVGAVLVPGAKAPKLIKREHLQMLPVSAVLVDVAVDQGGCFETTHPTTHENPTYMVENRLHYAVANMPGAVPHTSTPALTNATLPYALKLADHGWKRACKDNPHLANGLNIVDGAVVNQAVADAFDLPFTPVESVLN
jgi:alanine dehydrogenase